MLAWFPYSASDALFRQGLPAEVRQVDVRFCVLGSGSSGNAALLLAPRAHILVDLGFGRDELTERLAAVGAGWDTLAAALLTHTHSDHVKAAALRALLNHRVPLYCHQDHLRHLEEGRYAKHLAAGGLLRMFDGSRPIELPGQVQCRPLPLPHDCPSTCGFRLEVADGAGRPRGLAYLSDLGHWPQYLAQAVRGVDLLALEFNHDEDLERGSGRPDLLIDRVLGPEGHLSNAQAAEALLSVCDAERPRRLVLLHLSRECNRPELALRAAREALARVGARTEITTSCQEAPSRVITV
jgi:phosphoribosyl 1,2-cyclic phosphodiesterase